MTVLFSPSVFVILVVVLVSQKLTDSHKVHPQEFVDNPAISDRTLDHILSALGENHEQTEEDDHSSRFRRAAHGTYHDMKRSPLSTTKEYLLAITEEHNRLRALHGNPPLLLDKELSEAAQFYANYLGEASEGRTLPVLFRKGLYDVGGNIWAAVGRKEANHISPTFAWYNEERYYTYGNDSFCGMEQARGRNHVDHFTQLVWKGTEKVGCAKYKNRSKHIHVVCLYLPAGNVRGEYFTNVPKPLRAE